MLTILKIKLTIPLELELQKEENAKVVVTGNLDKIKKGLDKIKESLDKVVAIK